MFHVIPEPDAQFWKSYIYEVDDVDNKAKQDIDRKIAEIIFPSFLTEYHGLPVMLSAMSARKS